MALNTVSAVSPEVTEPNNKESTAQCIHSTRSQGTTEEGNARMHASTQREVKAPNSKERESDTKEGNAYKRQGDIEKKQAIIVIQE